MTLEEYKQLVTQQRNEQQQLAINAIKTIAQSTINNNNERGNN
jgi:hypothetical protein